MGRKMMIFVSVPLLLALPLWLLYCGVKKLQEMFPHWFRQEEYGTKEVVEVCASIFVFSVLCPAIVAIMAWGYGWWD
jgi:hypothetical protein